MFKIIPHTADIGLSVTASSREELFADAVFGLRSLLLSKISFKNSDLKKIQLEAITLEDLLVQWLSELNFLFETKYWMLARIDDLTISVSEGLFQLNANISGGLLEFVGSEIELEVKAVTHHDLNIEQSNDVWSVKIFFDL